MSTVRVVTSNGDAVIHLKDPAYNGISFEVTTAGALTILDRDSTSYGVVHFPRIAYAPGRWISVEYVGG